MQILKVNGAGGSFDYQWPKEIEYFDFYVEYVGKVGNKSCIFRVGFGNRNTYGTSRARVVVWVDGTPEAEFLGADDFAVTGEVLSEIRVPGKKTVIMCRYPNHSVPPRYMGLKVVGLKNRVSGIRVHNAWAVVTNISDHMTLCLLGALRKLERGR